MNLEEMELLDKDEQRWRACHCCECGKKTVELSACITCDEETMCDDCALHTGGRCWMCISALEDGE